jgi:hypothetical protein
MPLVLEISPMMPTLTIRLNTLLLVLLVFMAAAIIAILATRSNAGPLDPPAPPFVTGTFPQVQPRMPIPPVGWNGTFPIVIGQPGSYFFTQNLTGAANTDGISIVASSVTIDLNGFTLTGAGDGTHDGIVDNAAVSDTTIEHGVLTNWRAGMDIQGSTGGAIRDISASLNSYAGIISGIGQVVSDCTLHDNLWGINVRVYTQLRGCVIMQNGFAGGGVTGGGVQAEPASTIERNLIEFNAGHGNVITDGSSITISDNDLLTGVTGSDIYDTGGDNVVIRNRVTSCTSMALAAGTYAPITRLSGLGANAVGLVNTNVALNPNGAGLC